MSAIELVKNQVSRGLDMELASAICAETMRNGVITIRAGLFSNCVRFTPPLTIADAEIDEAMDVVTKAVDSVAS